MQRLFGTIEGTTYALQYGYEHIIGIGSGGGKIWRGAERVLTRCIRSRRGAWRANYTPKLKKRTALLRKLRDVFRCHQS